MQRQRPLPRKKQTTMSFEYDPKTKTYSARIVIGAKVPIPADQFRGALKRAILGQTGMLVKKLESKWQRERTDALFWFEEGWL